MKTNCILYCSSQLHAVSKNKKKIQGSCIKIHYGEQESQKIRIRTFPFQNIKPLYLNCIQNKFFNSNLFIWQIFHDLHSCFVHKIFHQNIIYFKDRSSVNLVRLQYNFRVCTIRFLVKSTSTSITSIVGHVVVGEDFTPQIFAPRHFSRLFFSCVSETKTLYL